MAFGRPRSFTSSAVAATGIPFSGVVELVTWSGCVGTVPGIGVGVVCGVLADDSIVLVVPDFVSAVCSLLSAFRPVVADTAKTRELNY